MKVTVFMIIVGIIFLCIFVGLLTLIVRALLKYERIDEDKTRHISIEIHFNLKPIPEVEQVTA